MTEVLRTNACSNCRRPISLLDGVGWLHGELAKYAHEEPVCLLPAPVDDEDYRVPRERP